MHYVHPAVGCLDKLTPSASLQGPVHRALHPHLQCNSSHFSLVSATR